MIKQSGVLIGLDKFILRSKNKHGDKYDYSKVVYINQYQKVIITCPVHGDFLQIPKSHMNGVECFKCKGKEKKTTEQFIKESKELYGDKYDYSKVVYNGARKKVIIICSEHGDFLQEPLNHLHNSGCPICANNVKKTTEDFISKSKEIHGDKYDYSKVIYNTVHSKVNIICKEHGDFLQTPYRHMSKQACPKCANNINSNTEDFISKSKEIHGDKYDYSKVDYVKAHNKVVIICPKHGDYTQRPNGHLRGYGCPNCLESHGEKLIDSILTQYKVRFIRQKKFKDCINEIEGRYSKKLPFDFYLPEYNTCIEYDGKQHFIPITIWGGEKELKNVQYRDKIKNKYCFDNGIKIIRIPYTMKNEEVKECVINSLTPWVSTS